MLINLAVKMQALKNLYLNLSCKLVNGINDGFKVTALFLDIQKAFDVVDHIILLNKMEQSGIRAIFHK